MRRGCRIPPAHPFRGRIRPAWTLLSKGSDRSKEFGRRIAGDLSISATLPPEDSTSVPPTIWSSGQSPPLTRMSGSSEAMTLWGVEFVEDHDSIDAFEVGQNFGAFLFRNDGASGAF